MRIIVAGLVLVGALSLFAWGLKAGDALIIEEDTASALRVSQGEEVPFALNSVDAGSDGSFCVWDFGDGTPIVKEANPTHVYEKCGTYTVTVIVPDAEGVERDTRFVVKVEEGDSKVSNNPGANSNWSTYWAKQDQAVVTGYTIEGSHETAELNKSQVTEKVRIVENPTASKKQAVAIRAPVRSGEAKAVQGKLAQAQQILDIQIRKNSILKGTSIYIRDCPNSWQGCAFYELGIIWIDPDHKASLEQIIIHECNHIIDWREDGDIDYDDS